MYLLHLIHCDRVLTETKQTETKMVNICIGTQSISLIRNQNKMLTGDNSLIVFLSSNADAIGFTVKSVGNSNGWIPSRNCVTNGNPICELHWSQDKPAIRVMLKSSGTKNSIDRKSEKKNFTTFTIFIRIEIILK